MIEMVEARNGRQVLRWDGRLLASSVDPVSEARQWLGSRRAFLDKVNTVFVLGAGAGYHVHELMTQTIAKVVVLECHGDLVSAVRALHAFDSSRVGFVKFSKARDLRADPRVRSGISESFVVLQHAPSMSLRPDVYEECLSLMLGRDWGSLNWQWQVKGFAPLETRPRIHTDREPLTILDLEKTELVQDSVERERMLVKALRELVK